MATTCSDCAAGLGDVVELALRDPAFRASLIHDPYQALCSLGIPWNQSRELRVLEDTLKRIHIVLQPTASEVAFLGHGVSDVLNLLAKKAAVDNEFYLSLLAAPHETIRCALGIAIPTSVELVIVVDTPSVQHLAIPAFPDSFSEATITDDMLDRAAIGIWACDPTRSSACSTRCGTCNTPVYRTDNYCTCSICMRVAIEDDPTGQCVR